VRAKLPYDWVENTVQDIWVGFYRSVQAHNGEIQNVGGYLYGVTRNKIADAVRKLTRERAIEYDSATEDDTESDARLFGVEVAAEEAVYRLEEDIVAKIELEFTQLVPFVDAVLSDCQRVVWMLVRMLNVPRNVVNRLLGKSYSKASKEYRNAHNALLDYFQSREFQHVLEYGELPKSLQFEPQREASVVVNRFAHMTTPLLTEDELKPLGLSVKEFQQHYVASIITPRWFDSAEYMRINQPSLLLTRREQRPDLGIHLRRLYDQRQDTSDTPLECIVNFTIEEGKILLEPASLVEMIPELDPVGWSDNMFVTDHEPRMTVPVIWGFWDESMVDEEELQAEFEHWPFMRGAGTV
ncbi:MAG: hypothetical protein KDE53_15870, partial [Caldilineaceae bacterium]|nr:hypothetical protein [Caldilineaceae bacterium]